MRYLYNVMIGFNQFINALFGGSADETICARAYLNRHRHPYKAYVKALDAVFGLWQGPGHCQRAFWHEQERKQYSREMQAIHEASQAAKACANQTNP